MGVIVNQRSFSCKDKDGDRREYHFQKKKDEGIQGESCSSFLVVTNDRIGALCQQIIVDLIQFGSI